MSKTTRVLANRDWARVEDVPSGDVGRIFFESRGWFMIARIDRGGKGLPISERVSTNEVAGHEKKRPRFRVRNSFEVAKSRRAPDLEANPLQNQ